MSDKKLLLIACIFVFVAFYFTTPHSLLSSVDIMWKPAAGDRVDYATATSNIGRQISLVALGVFAALVGYTKKTGAFRFNNNLLSVTVLLFVLLISMSILWSDDTFMTLKKVLVFHLVAFSAAAMARRFSMRHIMVLVMLICGATMIISMGVEIYLGTFQPLDRNYRFCGINHPNALAANCALLLLTLPAYATIYRRRPFYFGIPYLIPFLFLLLTKSRSALAGCLLAVLLFIFFAQPQRRKFLMLYLCCAVLPLCFLILYTIGDGTVFSGDALLLGRDTEVGTLTGRTPVWMDLNDFARQRRWLGYGYDSFWTVARTTYLMSRHGSWVASEHSSYFNMLLGLGIIGLTLFIAMLAAALGRLALLCIKSQSIEFGYCFALLSFVCINMFSETILFQPEFMTFLVLMIIVKAASAESASERCLSNQVSLDEVKT